MENTRWTWLAVILVGVASAVFTLPASSFALLGLLPEGTATILLTVCWVLAASLGAIGVAGVLLSDCPVAARPLPSPGTPDALVLGWAGRAGWIRLGLEAQQRHTLVLGGTGSGKTQFLLSLLAQQVARGGGVLMIDAKVDRSALQSVLSICRHVNRLHDLRLIWPPDPAISDTWNPLLRGSLEEVLSRVMALWELDRRGEAEFFRAAAQDIIRAVLGALKRLNPYVTMNDLYVALNTADLLLWLEGQVPPGTEEGAILTAFLANYRKGQAQLDIDRLKRLTGGASLHLSAYASGSLGKIMNHTAPSLDLLQAMQEGQIVYVALPILARTEEAVAMARMLVADLKQAVGALQQAPEKPNPPFLVLMDEASAYSNVQGIERLFEQARSAQVALVAVSQVVSGFTTSDRAKLDFILGNTATKVIMSLGDPMSATTMADTIGEEVRAFATQSTVRQRGTSAPWISPLPTKASKGNIQASGSMDRYDYIVRPEQLTGQPTGQAVVFARDPDTGSALHPQARTCLTQFALQPITLPVRPRLGPVGLDLQGLIQRGLLSPVTVSRATAPRDGRGTARAPRRRAPRRRETSDVVILEPAPDRQQGEAT